MIRFENLKKACKELNFKIDKRATYVAIITDDYREVMYLHMEKPWDINFYTSFNWLRPEEKVQLLKAITKDYEEHLNGD